MLSSSSRQMWARIYSSASSRACRLSRGLACWALAGRAMLFYAVQNTTAPFCALPLLGTTVLRATVPCLCCAALCRTRLSGAALCSAFAVPGHAAPRFAFALRRRATPYRAAPLQRFQLKPKSPVPAIAPLPEALALAIGKQVAQQVFGNRPVVDFQFAFEPRLIGKFLRTRQTRARALRCLRAQRTLQEYDLALTMQRYLARNDKNKVVYLAFQRPHIPETIEHASR